MKQKSIDIENRQESLSLVQNQIGNTVLLIAVIFGTLAALTSFFRSIQTGLTVANIIHLSTSVSIIIIYLFRKKLQGTTKVFITISLLILISIAGFYSYGIVSNTTNMMMAALVLTTVIFSTRQSFAVIILIMSIIVAGGILHFTHITSYGFTVIEYFNRPTSWISTFMATLMVVAIVTASLRKLHSYLFTLADSLDLNRKKLQASNEEFQAMNEEYEAQNKELYNAHYNLVEHEELFRAIFESANDCMVLVDKTGIVFQCNKQCKELFGESLKGKAPWNFSPEYQPDGMKSIDKAQEIFKKISRGNPQTFYWRRQHISGKFIETETTGRLMKAGDRTFILAIIRDITEQKKLEAQLIQAQKMEAMGTLTSGLAHDFNNILGGIMGGAGLIKTFIEKSEFEKKDKIKLYTDTITNSAHRASNMIDQLMNLSRSHDTDFEPVDLNQSLGNVLQIIQNSFPKSVTVKHRKHKKPAIINADQTQIEQVLLNLCINASHAMTIMRLPNEKEEGILNIDIDYTSSKISHTAISQKEDEETNYFEIKIIDTGVGMDKETQSQIFDPFFTTKAKGTGTGLGLSMVYNIIKNHGGYITVYSEPGSGSSFNVYLPETVEADSQLQEHTTTQTIIRGHGRVLVIDDEITQLLITEGILIECGFNVTTVSGGEEALIIFEKNPEKYKLVITDLSMPGMDGIEAYQGLKKINPHVKVIITSGFRYDPRIEKGLKMGINTFIEKPFSIINLSKVANEVINL